MRCGTPATASDRSRSRPSRTSISRFVGASSSPSSVRVAEGRPHSSGRCSAWWSRRTAPSFELRACGWDSSPECGRWMPHSRSPCSRPSPCRVRVSAGPLAAIGTGSPNCSSASVSVDSLLVTSRRCRAVSGNGSTSPGHCADVPTSWSSTSRHPRSTWRRVGISCSCSARSSTTATARRCWSRRTTSTVSPLTCRDWSRSIERSWRTGHRWRSCTPMCSSGPSACRCGSSDGPVYRSSPSRGESVPGSMARGPIAWSGHAPHNHQRPLRPGRLRP